MPYRYNPLPKQFDRVDITTVPDDVLKQVTTDVYDDSYLLTPGTVIPASNNINFYGYDTIEESDYGIRTNADPNNSANLYIELTNRVRQEVTVASGGSSTIMSINLGSVPGVYNFQGYASCFDSVTPSGAAFTVFGSVRTTGAAAVLIGTTETINDKEATLNDLDFEYGVSGNNATVICTNQTGLNVTVKILVNYIFVG